MRSRIFVFALLLMGTGVLNAQFTWTHTDGPYGSLFSSIFSNDQYAFIPAGDYLFRSTDGEHWEKLVHPVSDILAVWGDTLATLVVDSVSKKSELHVSTDQGEHWSVHPVPQNMDEYETGIYVCRSSINLPLIGENLMYRSVDLGATWDTISYPGEFSTQIVTLDSRLYVLRDDGIRRSDKDGNNWSAVIGPPFSSFEKSVAVTAFKDSILLFASDDHLWYTHDAGSTWANTIVYPSNSDVRLTLADQKIYAQAFDLLIRSDDFGITWDTLQASGLPILISTGSLGNRYLFSSFNKGVFRWDENVNSSVRSSSGLGFGYVNELTLGQDRIWAACPNGVFAYDLQSKTWSDHMDIPIPDKEPVFVSANDHGWVVTSGQTGGFYFSEDNGQSWVAIESNMFHLSGGGRDRVELLGNTMIALTNNGVMRSMDKGANWDWLAVESINSEIVRAHNNYYMTSSEFLYETKDDGLIWITHTLPFQSEGIGAYKDDLYLISYENHAHELNISTNGENWYPAGPGHYSSIGHAPYYYHNTYFRDEDHYYSLIPGNEPHVTSIADLTSNTLSMTQYGNDYVVLDSVIYLGGYGMYESKIEHPYITATDNIQQPASLIFTIHPNPVYDILHVSFDSGSNSAGMLSVYSPDGVLRFSKKSISGENQTDISIKDFPNSIYYVVFVSKNQAESHSFIKL